MAGHLTKPQYGTVGTWVIIYFGYVIIKKQTTPVLYVHTLHILCMFVVYFCKAWYDNIIGRHAYTHTHTLIKHAHMRNVKSL